MAEPRERRVLVVDDDPNLIADYRSFLTGRSSRGGLDLNLFTELEHDLVGAAVAHEGFPEIDCIAASRGRDAIESVNRALETGRYFTAAFIDMQLSRRFDGVRTASEIRALDPVMHIVLVADRCDIHPVDLSRRIAPADRLFFLRKPFHATEVQQFILAFASRERLDNGRAGWRT